MKLHTDVTHKTAINAFKNLRQKFTDVHGDKYDYSEVIYRGDSFNIDIRCKEHGIFTQKVSDHKQGRGCRVCGRIKQSISRTKTTEQFIKEATEIHGDKYDYSLVDYKGSSNNVDIICPLHSSFSQVPDVHLNGSGCPKCVGKNKTTEQFIKEATEIHKNKYDYSLVDYRGAHKKIDIICQIHGTFSQTPDNHKQGGGCPKCSGRNKTTAQFIQEAREIYGDKYDYSLVDYKGSNKCVDIICQIHGVFQQSPINHRKGQGCKCCCREQTNYIKYKDKKTTLYYIKIENYYKVGVTRTSVEKRFQCDDVQIEVLKTLSFEDGWEAFLLEQDILRKTKHLQIKKRESPIKGGWTEVRKCDISEFFPE